MTSGIEPTIPDLQGEFQRFIYLALFGQYQSLYLYPVESYEITVFLFCSTLPNLKWPKPRYGPSLFSLISSLLLKDISFIFILYHFTTQASEEYT